MRHYRLPVVVFTVIGAAVCGLMAWWAFGQGDTPAFWGVAAIGAFNTLILFAGVIGEVCIRRMST